MRKLTTLALGALIGMGAALAAPVSSPSSKSPTGTVLTAPTDAKSRGSKQLHDGGALHPGPALKSDGSVDPMGPAPAPIGEPKSPSVNVKTSPESTDVLQNDVLDGTQKQDSVDRSGAEELKGGKGLSYVLVPDELPIVEPAATELTPPPVTATAEEIRESEATSDLHQNRMSPLDAPVYGAEEPAVSVPPDHSSVRGPIQGDSLTGPSADQNR